MRPADETPVNLRPELSHYEGLKGSLQEPPSPNHKINRNPTKTIRLYDGDQRHRASVETSLREQGFRVFACDSLKEESIQTLEAALQETDVILFDFKHLNHHALSKLMLIEAFRRRHGNKPSLACSSVRRGTEFQQYLEYILGVDRIVYGK